MEEGARIIELADEIEMILPAGYTVDPQIKRGRIEIRSPDFMFSGNVIAEIIPMMNKEMFYLTAEDYKMIMIIF